MGWAGVEGAGGEEFLILVMGSELKARHSSVGRKRTQRKNASPLCLHDR